MVAFAGAGPWPQITSVRPRLVSCTMMGTSPPGPLRCGSTTCRVKAVATPASNALPPFSSVAMPTAVAIQCVEVTTPKVPSISGRVVNGLGLILPAMRLVPSCRPFLAYTAMDMACRMQIPSATGLIAASPFMDINNINHVGMAVRDLAATARRYEAMGFQLTPYSPHSAAWKPGDPVQPLGSGNRCVMFRGTYLEVLGTEDPRQPAAR